MWCPISIVDVIDFCGFRSSPYPFLSLCLPFCCLVDLLESCPNHIAFSCHYFYWSRSRRIWVINSDSYRDQKGELWMKWAGCKRKRVKRKSCGKLSHGKGAIASSFHVRTWSSLFNCPFWQKKPESQIFWSLNITFLKCRPILCVLTYLRLLILWLCVCKFPLSRCPPSSLHLP